MSPDVSSHELEAVLALAGPIALLFAVILILIITLDSKDKCVSLAEVASVLDHGASVSGREIKGFFQGHAVAITITPPPKKGYSVGFMLSCRLACQSDQNVELLRYSGKDDTKGYESLGGDLSFVLVKSADNHIWQIRVQRDKNFREAILALFAECRADRASLNDNELWVMCHDVDWVKDFNAAYIAKLLEALHRTVVIVEESSLAVAEGNPS